MRAIKIETLISLSIKRTRIILFKPFSLKKWLLLLFIAYMAGALGGGNGPSGGGGGGGPRHEKKAEAAAGAYAQDNKIDQFSGQAGSRPQLSPQQQKAASAVGIALASVVVVGLVLLGAGLLFLFMWLAARFKFIWFNAIVKDDASIREPFGRFRREGNSLFKFFLALLLVFVVFLGVLGGWVWLSGSSEGLFQKGSDWSFIKVAKVFSLPTLLFIAGILVVAILTVCVDHFVVSIMAMDTILFRDAWRKFAGIFKQNKKDFVIYFLVIIVLSIAVGVLGFLIGIVCFLLVLIAAGMLFGIPYFFIVALAKLNVLFWIYAVLVGIPFGVSAILLFASIGLPFAVFFRNFSLYFLSSLNCGYIPLSLDQVLE